MRISPAFLALFVMIPAGCRAQQHLTAPRADGHTTPLVLYKPSTPAATCAPLAVISHGAGGTEYGYRYLAESMAQLGYTTLVMGHAESGPDALRDSLVTHDHYTNIGGLVADPAAERDRLLDVTAALKWADGQCPGKIPFRVLLGHSMGAETVLLEAGMKNSIGLAAPPAAQDRFDAYIALSPSRPGLVAHEHAWHALTKPILILTGTRDFAVIGGPETRQIPYQDLPEIPTHCHWLGVIGEATHLNFAGVGPGADNVKPLVTQTIASFLKGVQSNACTLPAPTQTLKLQSK
jgi:dienelactone hydrolase